MVSSLRRRPLRARSVGRSITAAAASIEALEVRRLLTSFVVNTTQDETITNATTSLREAILLAEGTAGDDEIKFDATIFPQGSTTTISLTQGELQIFGTTAGKVTIDAEDANGARVKVSGNDNDHVFVVANTGNAELKGLMIADGFDTHWGGGIWNEATLVLRDVTVRENNLQGAAGTGVLAGESVFGAGLYNAASGTVTIRGSFFSTNSAKGGLGSGAATGNTRGGDASGGAIYSLGDLTVEQTDIAFNEALAGNGGTLATFDGAEGGDGFGGAIYAGVDAMLRLIDNSYTANVARGGSGGNGDATHPGGNGGDGNGAAVFSLSSDALIQRTAAQAFLENPFSSNVAIGGGGAGLGTPKGISGNAFGGGVDNQGTMSILGQGFIANHAIGGSTSGGQSGTGNGGAIYNLGSLQIDDTAMTTNHAFGGTGANQGASGGDARGGGLANDGAATVTGSTFTDNDALGGDNVGVGGTNGGNAQGGAIFSAGTLDVSTTTIADNIAEGGTAGDGGTAGLTGIFAGGGAISINGGTATIVDSTLSGNQSIGGAGGDGSVFGGDGGNGLGGAMFNAGDTTLLNSTLYGNTARGGAPGADPTNNANGGGAAGGAINQTIAGSLTAVNVTITANQAIGAPGASSGLPGNSIGGGIENNFPDVKLTNTIIGDNGAENGTDLHGEFTLINSLTTSPPASSYTVLPGSSGNLLDTGTGLGPLVDNGGPTLTARLLAGSLAINAGNDAAAMNAFPAEHDQRGDGFPRIVGPHVDIGAVENQGPTIIVSGNGNPITNGDTTPSATDFTNFGAAQQGAAAALQRVFVIANQGEDDLEITQVHLPSGYSLVGGLPAPIAPGASAPITIRLSTANAGTFAGNVVIDNNDFSPDPDSQFTFRVTGTITPVSTGTPPVKINFEPSGRPVPSGFLADVGLVFASRGNGFSYGWNQSITNGTRDRNINPDQKLDTLVHTQLFGSRTWEIGVPNGTYLVKVVAGDPQYFDSVYKINVEGVLTVNGTPSSGNRFITGTKAVTVSDGKLTVTNATGAVNNKLNYLEITPVTAPVKINFQPAGRPIPSGFFADTGLTFANRGNGFSYGWNNSASSFTRDRNINADQKLDTLVHTQLFGVRTWELGVINGTYQVKLVAGDPQYFDSVYKFNVEGQLAVNGTPTSGSRFITGTRTVTVTDGKLTISNASGSVNNKLAFIEVTPV